MANDKISGMAAAVVADVAGSAGRMELCKAYATAPTTLGLDFATLRTSMFAGGTGYTATDPLVCGAISTSGDFAVASTKFTVASASGNTAVAGTLAVTGTTTLTGNVGVGGAVNSGVGLYVQSAALSGTTQHGVYVLPVFTSSGTTAAYAVRAKVTTATAAYTVTECIALLANAPSLGVGSAITTNSGIYVANQGASGITNAYGVYIAAQSGAATVNRGLYNGGDSNLVGNVSIGAAIPAAHFGLLVRATLATTTQYGVVSDSSFTSAATSSGMSLYAQVKTAASAFTMTNGYGLYVDNASIGATSAITNLYGIYIAAQSGAATTNIGLYNAGTTTLADALSVAKSSNAAFDITVYNATSGTAALAGIIVGESGSAGKYGLLRHYSDGYTTSGSAIASCTVVAAGYAGDLLLVAGGNSTTRAIQFWTGAGGAQFKSMELSGAGYLGIGEAATATSGLHIKKANIPTSAAGLAAGDVWSNSGVLTIV